MNFNYTRPFLYNKQYNFVNDKHRFVCCEASTKSGKTLGCIVWEYEECILPERKRGDNVWWIAPTYSQTKIAFDRLKRYLPKNISTANESSLSFKFFNGVKLTFKTGDNPDSLYGDDVVACVIDEASRCREESWWAIRSTLTATQGKCRFIGNIKGVTNWFYKLCRKAETGDLIDWSYHKITSKDAVEAGVFSQKEFDEAQATLPPEIFNELYLCIPFDDRGKPFMYSFDTTKNICESYIADTNLPVWLSFDFNVNPICCTLNQHTFDLKLKRTFAECRLKDANTYELSNYIKNTFPAFNYYVTGDASGVNRSTQSNLNNFQIISQELQIPKNRFMFPHQNPSHADSRTLSNALFNKHPDNRIVKDCKYLIQDLREVQVDFEGKIDKKSGSMTHLLDCHRYYDYTCFNNFIKI